MSYDQGKAAAKTRGELRETLEGMVDAATLAVVLQELGEVCAEKAEHLRENWQDSESARSWQRAGGKVDAASVSGPVAQVS